MSHMAAVSDGRCLGWPLSRMAAVSDGRCLGWPQPGRCLRWPHHSTEPAFVCSSRSHSSTCVACCPLLPYYYYYYLRENILREREREREREKERKRKDEADAERRGCRSRYARQSAEVAEAATRRVAKGRPLRLMKGRQPRAAMTDPELWDALLRTFRAQR